MRKIAIAVFIVIAATTAAVILRMYGYTLSFNKPAASPSATQLVGNDRDAHGCIGSAGYSWCQSKSKCIRIWEESCPSPTPGAKQNDTSKNEADLIASVKAGLIAEHGPDAAGMNVTVSAIEGDYAKGMASSIGGGGIWFAAKVNGEWKLIWDGNGIIQCGDIAQYNFPVSLIPSCWDQSSGRLISR